MSGISTLKDGSLSIRFTTQEMNSQQKVVAMEYAQSFGWLLFQEQEFEDADLDLAEIRRDIGGKTPSQRLRAVLYISYSQSGRIDLTFEQYYAQKMEAFIQRVKDTLAE